MLHAYTEDQLVEQSAIGSLAELGVVLSQNFHRTCDLLLPRLLSGQVKLAEREVSA